MTADEIIRRIKNKNNTDNDWLEIHKEIIKFLNENPKSPDRKYFVPLGYLEMVSIICNGIKKNNS